MTDDGFNCPNFGNLEILSSLDSNEVFSIGNSQIPHIVQTVKVRPFLPISNQLKPNRKIQSIFIPLGRTLLI